MKQHITVVQLKELDKNQFMKLYKKVRTTTHASLRQVSNIYNRLHKGEGFGPNKLISEINIGVMVDLLWHYHINMCHDYDTHLDMPTDWWVVTVYLPDEMDNEDYEEFISSELADALWEAVKYLLEN